MINDELERMSRLVDDLLLLARADRPDFLRPEPLDLDLLSHEMFAKARSLGVRRWLFDGAGVGLIHADPRDRVSRAGTPHGQRSVRRLYSANTFALWSGPKRVSLGDTNVGSVTHRTASWAATSDTSAIVMSTTASVDVAPTGGPQPSTSTTASRGSSPAAAGSRRKGAR